MFAAISGQGFEKGTPAGVCLHTRSCTDSIRNGCLRCAVEGAGGCVCVTDCTLVSEAHEASAQRSWHSLASRRLSLLATFGATFSARKAVAKVGWRAVGGGVRKAVAHTRAKRRRAAGKCRRTGNGGDLEAITSQFRSSLRRRLGCRAQARWREGQGWGVADNKGVWRRPWQIY